MGDHRLGAVLRLVRDGVGLGIDFGTHSLEALLWIAETVEQSVYVPHSLHRTASGLAFALANPPLRVGAFSSVRGYVDGRPIPPGDLRLRLGEGRPWRTGDSIGDQAPIELEAGTPVEFEFAMNLPPGIGPVTIRVEWTNVAIPPLVWLEFTEPIEGLE